MKLIRLNELEIDPSVELEAWRKVIKRVLGLAAYEILRKIVVSEVEREQVVNRFKRSESPLIRVLVSPHDAPVLAV